MSTQLKQYYTLEEYFALELSSEEKYEFWNGEVFCKSGVSMAHSQIESNLTMELRNRLDKHGCRVFPANLRIKVPACPPYRYPDLTARMKVFLTRQCNSSEGAKANGRSFS